MGYGLDEKGMKMSKSLGNVVDPYAVVAKYGTDAVRYYLLGALPSYDDGDWSEARLAEFYTAHLANGVGNLVSRTTAMVERYFGGRVPEASPIGSSEATVREMFTRMEEDPRDLTAALFFYCKETHAGAHGAEADALDLERRIAEREAADRS